MFIVERVSKYLFLERESVRVVMVKVVLISSSALLAKVEVL